MHIGRAIIIPAILALGVAGSALAGSAISAVAGSAPSVQVHAAAATPDTFYHS